MRRQGRKQRGNAGFTVVELMIVVAVLAIAAVISFPSVLEARKNSNESTAIASLRTIASAQAMFREGDKDGDGLDYAESMAQLQAFGLVDESFGSGTQNGYTFTVSHSDAWQWGANADPVIRGKTGDRSFYIDESGAIRFNLTDQAGPTDPEVGA